MITGHVLIHASLSKYPIETLHSYDISSDVILGDYCYICGPSDYSVRYAEHAGYLSPEKVHNFKVPIASKTVCVPIKYSLLSGTGTRTCAEAERC